MRSTESEQTLYSQCSSSSPLHSLTATSVRRWQYLAFLSERDAHLWECRWLPSVTTFTGMLKISHRIPSKQHQPAAVATQKITFTLSLWISSRTYDRTIHFLFFRFLLHFNITINYCQRYCYRFEHALVLKPWLFGTKELSVFQQNMAHIRYRENSQC